MEKTIEQLKASLKKVNLEYAKIKTLPEAERKKFGDELNRKKAEIVAKIREIQEAEQFGEVEPIDITAPMAPNSEFEVRKRGTKHPLVSELYHILDIYSNMGFNIVEARQLDDEFHMFKSLNFPDGHPAMDGYDTFRTTEGFIPPAHTSTMQYRILQDFAHQLEEPGGQIAVVMPGRVFRNEDVDATHEHTFYQCEGIFVSETASLAQMLGVLAGFFSAYYQEEVDFRTQPGYFPFTEPSVEFLIKKPAALAGKNDEWLEMLGCGVIHPNVLKIAGIDPKKYRGFAWGGGIERLVMLKYGINDIRHFEAGKLDFLTKGVNL